MATDLKRFTVSITSSMEEGLDKVKKELYYKDTQSSMIRDLIIRGLRSLEQEKAVQSNEATIA